MPVVALKTMPTTTSMTAWERIASTMSSPTEYFIVGVAISSVFWWAYCSMLKTQHSNTIEQFEQRKSELEASAEIYKEALRTVNDSASMLINKYKKRPDLKN